MSDRPGIVIIGGGPAGLQTARSYRESGGKEEVTILSRESHLPYNRPPLTKQFLRGEMSASELPLESPDWFSENRIEVRTGTEVTALDTEARKVAISDGEEISYSECVLTTGSRPALPPVPGSEDPDICVLRTLEDSEAVIAASRKVGASDGRFIVIGSGFIGCEAAASLAMLDLDVVMVTMEDEPQRGRLGPDAARELRSWLLELGVEIRTGTEISRIDRTEDGFRVSADSGVRIEGRGLLIGAGMQPNIELAESAGLTVDDGVVCDSSMRASDAHVYAAGDVALAFNDAAGRSLRVEHWGDTLGQGKVCGEVLAGRKSSWGEVPGFWSTVGNNTLKYAAWGDGWDETRFVGGSDAFTVWYGLEGNCVGVLSYNVDSDYESGRTLIKNGARLPI